MGMSIRSTSYMSSKLVDSLLDSKISGGRNSVSRSHHTTMNNLSSKTSPYVLYSDGADKPNSEIIVARMILPHFHVTATIAYISH
jgi:hypothetical protein